MESDIMKFKRNNENEPAQDYSFDRQPAPLRVVQYNSLFTSCPEKLFLENAIFFNAVFQGLRQAVDRILSCLSLHPGNEAHKS